MPIATAIGGPGFQPYQCHICQSRFTRHENLKRHAALHSRPRKADALSCTYCHSSFSRADLRTRHMRRKHPEQCAAELSPGLKQRGRSTGSTHTRVLLGLDDPEMESQIGSWQVGSPDDDNDAPNSTFGSGLVEDGSDLDILSARRQDGDGVLVPQLPSIRHHLQHNDFQPLCHPDIASQVTSSPDRPNSEHMRAGSYSRPRTFSFDQSLSSFDFSLPQPTDSWLPSVAQNNTGTHLYFTHVSHFVPFLHQPTYDAAATPDYLRLAMLCLAFQYGEDPDHGYDEGSGGHLSIRCYHRSRALIALTDNGSSPHTDSTRMQTMVQAYLLLEIFAMFYLPSTSGPSDTDTTPATVSRTQLASKTSGSGATHASTDSSAMHARLIALARSGGLMQPLPVQATPTQDLQSLWMQFVRNESHKRTLFAVHQLDALWYQLLSIPRSISHLEIKHELPCPEDYWVAPSADQWAHRKLLSSGVGGTGNDNYPVSYAEAVRRFISSDGETDVSLPPFDAYGAINIAQFLISSAREISGWSTITGVLSLERLQPLKSSLVALSPAIHPEPETAKATHAGLMCEAIWEIAMIELQLWSPAHTDGIVRGSIEDLLRHSTQLPPLSRFLYESITIQPHIDWFLHYLEASVSPNLEAPWIPLYAYKAFLIAFQLVCEHIPGAMQVVGVQDGDGEGALLWAKKVFRRRRHWFMGQVILDCLSLLST